MPSRPAHFFSRPHSAIFHRVKRLGLVCATIIIGFALAGCAAQMAYREGKSLIAQGKAEEGLAKFQEAVAHEPRGIEYRSAYLQTRDHVLTDYYRQAEKLTAENKWAEAEKLYERMLTIDPNNQRARAGLRTVEANQRHIQLLSEAETAWSKKDADDAQFKLRSILMENPNHAGALALKRTMAEKTAKPPVESALSVTYKKPITIEFKDVTLKQVFEVISRTSGLNFLFDKDVKTDQRTSIFLKNSTIASAVHFTLLTNQLEEQVLDGNTILIYPNTAAKQKDYQEMVVKTFFLSNTEAKAVANTLKTIIKSRDIVIDEKLNMLIVRDSPEAIRLAEKLVALHDVPQPEVMLEVEILEVKRTRLQELGIKWPESLTLTPLPSTTSGVLTLNDLRNLNADRIGAGIGPVIINAKRQDSDANILANPRIRARNHEKAKILIGDRVPNITTTSTSTGFVSESVNYIDVGLKLDVEPTIYLDNDVAINVSLEVSNIVNQLQTKSGSVAYQIGTRTASTVLRLKDGENQVLAGLINDQDRRTASKVPGLGEIPVLGRLFGSTADDGQKTEIVLSITPHLIRNIQRPEAALAEFSTGTDSSFRTRPESGGSIMPPALPNTPRQASPQITQVSANPASLPNNNMPVAAPSGGNVSVNTNNGMNDAGLANAIGGGVVNNQIAPSSNVQLKWQGPAQAKMGETFALQLLMQSDRPVSNIPLAVGFDNKALQVVSITEGEFLKQGGAQTSFSSRIDTNGQILLSNSRAGNSGATGLGSVAIVNFRALTPAEETRIQLLTASPTDAGGSMLVTPFPPPFTVQVQP